MCSSREVAWNVTCFTWWNYNLSMILCFTHLHCFSFCSLSGLDMRWCKTRLGQWCAEREEFYCLRISSYSATIHWCEMGISGGNWPHLNSRELWCDPETIIWKFCFCLWLVVVVGHPQTLMQEDIKCEKFTDYINNVWAGESWPPATNSIHPG